MKFVVGQKVKFTKEAEVALGVDPTKAYTVLSTASKVTSQVYNLGGEHIEVSSHWLEAYYEACEHHQV